MGVRLSSCLVKPLSPGVGKKVSEGFESKHSFASKAMREAPAMFKRSWRGNTKMKRVDENGVIKGGWGKVGFCSSHYC